MDDIMLTQPIDLEQKHLHPLYRRKWVVFAKRPVAGSEKAVEYIGRYAHRIAIANSRIREVTDEKVVFHGSIIVILRLVPCLLTGWNSSDDLWSTYCLKGL